MSVTLARAMPLSHDDIQQYSTPGGLTQVMR